MAGRTLCLARGGLNGLRPAKMDLHRTRICGIESRRKLPEGSAVIVRSIEYETINIMRDHGLIPLPLAFFLDPEGGFESNNILPEPKLRGIDQWLEKALEEKQTASLAYRLTPYTQYPSDYYFFRRQLNPAQSRASVLSQLGEFICNPRVQEEYRTQPSQFASAIESLDKWWNHRDAIDLNDAVNRLDVLNGTRDLADAAKILRQLARGTGDQSLEAFTEELRLQMSPMPIFRGLTLDYLWSRRAEAFLQLRVQNWMRRFE